MALPLFDPPAPKRVGVDDPLYFAWHAGFRQGVDGQAASRRYDPDDEMNDRYQDGHRIGKLFETRLRRKTEWKEPQR